MNLSRMNVLFKDYVADTAETLTSTTILDFLDRAYQYTIPSDVGGEMSEQLWELETTAGTASYSYPDTLVAPNAGTAYITEYRDTPSTTVSVGPYGVRFVTDPASFESWFASGAASTGIPDTALFYARTVRFSPAPSLDYNVTIPSRGGPTTGIGVTGIANEVHAQAVVFAAAADYLASQEDTTGYALCLQEYERYKEKLQTYAHARPNSRRSGRSF